jgi:hypothetical protein
VPPASLTQPGAVLAVLLLQVLPLLLFPASVFAPTTQEWWLPALLAALVLVANAELIVRRSAQLWPWHLMIFAHGFNIISRLMMVWSHATKPAGGATIANLPYLITTVAAMALSAWLLWYLELPAVRIALLRRARG